MNTNDLRIGDKLKHPRWNKGSEIKFYEIKVIYKDCVDVTRNSHFTVLSKPFRMHKDNLKNCVYY